jgi:two-component system chemotaxis response regulator CheB
VKPIHVLVIDDSAVVREVMRHRLPRGGMRVTLAPDPVIAMRKMELDRPDVILLDLEMPRMDGREFLRRTMAEDPLPIVVCSAHPADADAAFNAIEHGALAVVQKPALGVRGFLEDSVDGLVETLRAAAEAKVSRVLRPAPKLGADAVLPHTARPKRADAGQSIVAIGASTGGTEALRLVLEALPADAPALAIVQHMPEGFTAAFARRLETTCRIEVREAKDGDRLERGLALIAPGNRHLIVRRSTAGYAVELSDGPPVSRHRPSVDVLLRSVAIAAGSAGVGVILTGMGDDGAHGLLEMRRAGASTIAQDEASCVVFGMPREAIARGGVDEVVPLSRIAAVLLERAARGRARMEPADRREG